MADLQDLMTGEPAQDRMIQTLLTADDFVYNTVAPRMGVDTRSGAIGVIDIGDKVTDTSYRADRDVAPEIEDMTISEQSYNCKAIDRSKFIGNGELNHNKYATSNVVESIYSERLTLKLKLLREIILRDSISNLSNYKTENKATLTGTDQFTHASCKPINLLLDKAVVFKQKNGVMADTIFFSFVSYIAFIKNASVAPLLPDPKYKVVTSDDILPLLKTGALAGLKKVVIGSATMDTNSKKDARNGDFIWADDVWLYKQAEPIKDSKLTSAGFVVSVESEDPEDFGSRLIEPEDRKGKILENRISQDLLNCSQSSTYDYAMILHDTNA